AGVYVPTSVEGCEHSFYLYTLRITSGGGSAFARRDRVAQKPAANGIASSVFYPVPLHLQPAYKSLGGKPGDLPVAERAAQEVLSIPLYAEMTPQQLDRVADAVIDALNS